LISDEARIGCLEALVSCDLEAVVETVLVDKGSGGAGAISANPTLILADKTTNLALAHPEVTLLLIKEVHLLKIHIDFILFQVISECFAFSILNM